MNISFILFTILNIIGCKPDEGPPKPVENPSPIIWKKLLSKVPASSLNSTPIYYNETIIVGKKEVSGYMVKARNIENGDSIWQTSLGNTGGFNPLDERFFLYQDKLVLSDGTRSFVMDASNGNLLWKHQSENMTGTSCVIDDYLYKADEVDRNTSSLYRYDLNTGFEEKLFTINRVDYGRNYSPGLLMPVKWMHPNGDEILVLQNRSYGWFTDMEPKMDILAWNLTADSMLWYRERLDGFSSMSSPAISGDKVYFYGDHHAYCINPSNGETIWKYFIGNGPEDDFNTANVLIIGDKLVVKPDSDDMHVIDKETGKRIWFNGETRAGPGLLIEHKDTIWFSSGWVLGIDANTGKKLIEWDNNDRGSWIFPVAHHPTNGYIYTSDARYLYCLDPRYMK